MLLQAPPLMGWNCPLFSKLDKPGPDFPRRLGGNRFRMAPSGLALSLTAPRSRVFVGRKDWRGFRKIASLRPAS
jgi:hypothetical protein